MISKLRLLALAALACLFFKRFFSAKRKKPVKALTTNEEGFSHGKLDIRRKAQIGTAQVGRSILKIARGTLFVAAVHFASRLSHPIHGRSTLSHRLRSLLQAMDYARVGVVVSQNESFDLDKTIFASIKSPLTRAILQKKLAITLSWNDHFIDQVHEAMLAIPASVPVSSDIFDFMRDECDFSCEHADGSFMDHLRFCYDYSAAHFKNQSPRVMLLHSIMGVGTNIFPMEATLEQQPFTRCQTLTSSNPEACENLES